MKCANPMLLSTEGSFEQIVNKGTSASRRIKKEWLIKTVRVIVVMLAIFLINVLLWVFRVMPSVPSIYVSEILTCAISFLAGRIYERFFK